MEGRSSGGEAGKPAEAWGSRSAAELRNMAWSRGQQGHILSNCSQVASEVSTGADLVVVGVLGPRGPGLRVFVFAVTTAHPPCWPPLPWLWGPPAPTPGRHSLSPHPSSRHLFAPDDLCGGQSRPQEARAWGHAGPSRADSRAGLC